MFTIFKWIQSPWILWGVKRLNTQLHYSFVSTTTYKSLFYRLLLFFLVVKHLFVFQASQKAQERDLGKLFCLFRIDYHFCSNFSHIQHLPLNNLFLRWVRIKYIKFVAVQGSIMFQLYRSFIPVYHAIYTIPLCIF